MNTRPRLKLKLTATDKVFEIAGWFLLLMMWLGTLIGYETLPETVPIHYNLGGQADAFGGKLTLVRIPLLATILFIGLTVLNRFPHAFNYPTAITQDNAHEHYTLATRLLRYLKFSIVFIFGLLVFKTFQHAIGKADGLGIWFLPLALGLVFIPLVYVVIQFSKPKH